MEGSKGENTRLWFVGCGEVGISFGCGRSVFVGSGGLKGGRLSLGVEGRGQLIVAVVARGWLLVVVHSSGCMLPVGNGLM